MELNVELKEALKDVSLLRHQAYVAGEWRAADSGGTLEVFDPATGNVLHPVPGGGIDPRTGRIVPR